MVFTKLVFALVSNSVRRDSPELRELLANFTNSLAGNRGWLGVNAETDVGHLTARRLCR
jgi:hypothetical protein